MNTILTRPLKINDTWLQPGEKVNLKKEEFNRLFKLGAVVQPFNTSEEKEMEENKGAGE